MATDTADLVFTPRSAGRLVVSVDYVTEGFSGGDWGSSYETRVFMTQNGSTSYGDAKKHATARAYASAQYIFNCNANQEVTCGLEVTCNGATALTVSDITIRAHMAIGGS